MLKRTVIPFVLLAFSPALMFAQESGQPSDTSTPSSSVESTEPMKADAPLYQQEESTTESPIPEIKATPTYTSSFIENSIEGGTPFKRPVLIPTFSFSQSLTSGESTVGNGQIWKGQQHVAGTLQFRWDVGNSGSMAYNGTGIWNSFNSEAQTVQQFGYTQRLRFGRWMASFTDQATYSPQSTFGFGGLQGIYGSSALGSLGGGMIPPGTIPGTTPSQTVLTTDADRVSNTTAGELQYSFTPRTAMRFGGSYGFIRGIDTSLLNGNQYSGSAGLDYRMDPSDTIGLNYAYSVYSFPDSQEDTRSHSAGVSFARRLTARLSSQVYVGAQYTDAVSAATSYHQLSWGTSGYLNYHRTRNSLGLQFYHGVTGGSGVFPGGSNTSHVSLSFSRTLTPKTNFSMTGGYARNTAFQAGSSHTNTYFAGASANRAVGRYASVYFGYTVQQQTLGSGIAVPTAFNGIQHMFSLGLSWSYRPIRLGQ